MENEPVADGDDLRQLLSTESIKMVAEAVGVTNLSDDASTRLSEDLEHRLKEAVQHALKFARHSKRRKLTCSDFDRALSAKNVEPLYGFDCAEYVPFQHASGGGKELYYLEDRELDLLDVVNVPLPHLPYDVSLRAHWLAVQGVQPAIPENPPALSLEEQKKQALALVLPGHGGGSGDNGAHLPLTRELRFDGGKRTKKKEEAGSGAGAGGIGGGGVGEWSKIKPLQAHGLSMEQQLYYREITEACIGLADSKRQEALTSLSADPGLYLLLPQLCNYIVEGIKVNAAQRKLNLLKHLLKMAKALLDNQTVSLERYLHELIPVVTTCLVNRQLCLRPESEDHWGLRDLAAKVLAQVCRRYGTPVNGIQSRVTRVLSQALQGGGGGGGGLAAHYGAIAGLAELGQEAVVSLVLPQLRAEGELIRQAQPQSSSTFTAVGGGGGGSGSGGGAAAAAAGKAAEQVAASRVQSLVQRVCVPVLLSIRSPTDTLQMYQSDYGHLGVVLYNQVKVMWQGKNANTGGGVGATVTAVVGGSSGGGGISQAAKVQSPPPSPLLLTMPTASSSSSSSSSSSGRPAPLVPPQVKVMAGGVGVGVIATPTTPTTPTTTVNPPTTPTHIGKPLQATITSPTIAAALRLISQQQQQGTGSGGGGGVSSPITTIPASLLTAMFSNPSAAQAVLASHFGTVLANGGGSGGGGVSGSVAAPPCPSPTTTTTTTTASNGAASDQGTLVSPTTELASKSDVP